MNEDKVVKELREIAHSLRKVDESLGCIYYSIVVMFSIAVFFGIPYLIIS
jgi:hypothetical protein